MPLTLSGKRVDSHLTLTAEETSLEKGSPSELTPTQVTGKKEIAQNKA